MSIPVAVATIARALLCASIAVAAMDRIALAAESGRPSPLKSGIEFASKDVRTMQADDFANPGMLWVTRGEASWNKPAGKANKSCADCHGHAAQSMRGVAVRYPVIDPASARPVNIEGRVNLCRTRHQQAEPLPYESDELLALSTYVAHQSRGMPMQVELHSQNQRHFERGRDLYHRRIGQMNLACVHCHQRNWGKRLLAQTLSQGHGNAYPAYRLEWQTLGSLQRRLRACYYGVRAEMPAYGAEELLDLELYLAWRARGLPIETPGVRR
ncbi:MAG: sulfur oxidation c-type cytochrome SoxA [Betaproteobacteria bacterium]|nr:sulfur oxidation c-type cytochrome SoxA [Betaproteobacteria bacterium]